MYDELKRRGGGGIEDIEEIKANPAPKLSVHVTNNNTGSGSNVKEANNWLTNTQAAIDKKDINAINQQFQILERGGRFVNVSAKEDKDGNVKVEYSSPQADGELKTFERTFKNDSNLQNQLKGIYQAMTGEDKVFEYSKPATNPPKPGSPKPAGSIPLIFPNGKKTF